MSLYGTPFLYTGPISFIFMQCLANIWLNNRFLAKIQGLASPVWEILDPPLEDVVQNAK